MDAAPQRISVWDWPVRVSHWLFALLIPLAWWTAEEHMFEWHLRIGIAMLALLLFRLIWGLVGSSTARFANFIKGPGAVLRYVRGERQARAGHSPLGALSVAALLLAMLVQVGLGLFATDEDGISSGPLNHLIGFDAGETVTDLHETNFNILLALIALHIAAILYYLLFKRRNLVRPMVRGWDEPPEPVEGMQPAGAGRAVLALLAALAITWWIYLGAPLG